MRTAAESKAANPLSLLALLLLTLPFLAPPAAHPQGCAQCRDSISQTPAKTQHAYREAILALATAATLVCASTALIIIRRYR